MEMENYSSVILTDNEWDQLTYWLYGTLGNKTYRYCNISDKFADQVKNVFEKICNQLDGEIDVESESE